MREKKQGKGAKLINLVGDPALHPNGFIQQELAGGLRLHVWHPDIPQAQVRRSPIHDHTFMFESEVVLGELTHETFYVNDARIDATHEVYAVQRVLLVPTTITVRADSSGKQVFKAGRIYNFGGPGNYHDSRGSGLTATIMTKRQIGLAPFSTVLVPIGQEPDNDFRRDQYPPEALRPFVAMVLEQLGD